ncbi:MAG: hypothetical protein LBP76_14875 [Treponema sp.]|jgi:hypothetical protein|nr:hypothetical protein [Treponema sp.]
MADATDLYSILAAYARKNNTPFIDITVFQDVLEKNAQRLAAEHPEWLRWTKETGALFWSELSPLVEKGKCELLSDTSPEGTVYLPDFYLEAVQEAYSSLDNTADQPFPSEESLRITLPENQVRTIGMDDIVSYLDDPQDAPLPLIRLTFSEGFGSAITTSRMIPRRLLEAAMLKIRNYLRNHGNREFAQHKLEPQMQGKEIYIRDILNQILSRPIDCVTNLENVGDFTYLFWAHFCILVKNDIRKKKEYLFEDIASMQSVYLIEVCNNYYKAKSVKKREKALAFKALEIHLDQPPYLYTLNNILRFTNSKGVLLLGQYSEDDLDAYIKAKTGPTDDDDEQPELFLIRNEKGDLWFVRKGKLLSLISRLLIEARPLVKKAISKRWFRMLKQYRNEPAMENDAEFEKLLAATITKVNGILANLFNSPKLFLVYQEIEQKQGNIPESLRIFQKGMLVPYSDLFLLKRKDLLVDARILLPFWYSIPLFTAILAFFKGRKSREGAKKEKEDAEEKAENEVRERKDPHHELVKTVKRLEAEIIPANTTIDDYLSELKDRWNRLINAQAKKDLSEDVDSFIRDYLRHFLRTHKRIRISRESLSKIASDIISRNSALISLKSQDALHLYIEIYLLHLLQNVKILR